MTTIGLFDRIVKIEVAAGPILVLYLDSGNANGGGQTNAPPMLVSGIPGAAASFDAINGSDLRIKPGGKPTPIVDPISGAMRGNLLTWGQQQKVVPNKNGIFGQTFLFCNIGGMRQFAGKGFPVTFQVTTPGSGTSNQLQTYYWVYVNGSPFPNAPFNNNPLSPKAGGFGGAVVIYTDPLPGMGAPGSVLIASSFGQDTTAIMAQFDVFTVVAALNTPPGQVQSPNLGIRLFPPGVSIATQQFPFPDSTSWGIRAALWRKQKTFADLIPVYPDQTFPKGSPAPDSFAFKGGTPPSSVVTVKVTAGNEATVTLG